MGWYVFVGSIAYLLEDGNPKPIAGWLLMAAVLSGLFHLVAASRD